MPSNRPPSPRRPAWCTPQHVGCAWLLLVLAVLSVGAAWAQPAPAGAASPAPQAPPAGPPPAADSGPRFDIWLFEIEGNTLLPDRVVEQAVMPQLGPGGSMARVEAARAALERAYQQAGYLTVFVDVPEQEVREGTVRLQVLQGRVDRVRVSGAQYHAPGVIRRTVAALQEGHTPDFNRVQQQLAELNRGDERSVQPVLRPGRLPGTVEVELQVKDRLPAEASLELHNRHAAATAPWRLTASGRYGNLWQAGHSLSLTWTTAPQHPGQSRIAVLNYGVPLADDASLALYAVHSNSLVEPLTAVSVAGKGNTLGLRWMQPLPGTAAWPGFSHSLTLGADYKDFDTRIGSSGASTTTPLRYLPLQLGYNAQWSQGTAGSRSLSTQLSVAQARLLRRELDCADAGRDDQFNCSASGTDGSFAAWRGEWRETWGAPGAAQLVARLGWQLATDPLVGNERWAIGGAETVRGYSEAEASGDRGALLSLEWRSRNLAGWLRPAAGAAAAAPSAAASAAPSSAAGPGASAGTEPAAPGGLLRALDELVTYAFLEGGEVRVLNAAAGQPGHTALRGAGLGAQWRFNQRGQGQLDLAWPLVASSASPFGLRVHLRLTYPLM